MIANYSCALFSPLLSPFSSGQGLGRNNAGAKYGTGYCDAQCPHDIKFIEGEANIQDWTANPNDPNQGMGAGYYGACCGEMDIWEANSMANAYTPHPCDMPGQLRCEGIECGDNEAGERYEGVCDKDGCDMHPYRLGNRMFFGRGSEYDVDTLKPVTVVTQFLTTDGTDSGDLSEIVRYYVQDGNVIQNPTTTLLGPGNDHDRITDEWCIAAKRGMNEDHDDFTEKGGNKAMGESLDRGHVMAISLWDDVEVNMLWLDSAFPLDLPATDPGVQRGDCPGGEESTPQYLRQNHPDGWTSFTNAFVGPIGSFLVHPTQAPTPGPSPSPSPVGSGCCRFGVDCGDCGEDGTGWCHQSASNCNTCTGTWDPSRNPPGCGGSPSPPPSPPTSCSDGNPGCPAWAASGECQRNPGWMLENCRLSCNNCPAQCTDNNPGCPAWAASGEW